VAGLFAQGCHLAIFGLSKPTDDFYEQFDTVEIAYGNLTGAREKSCLSKVGYLKEVLNLKRLYNGFKPDIVHAHYASSYGLLGSFLRHSPYLISVWGSDIFEFPKVSFFNRTLLKRNLSKATHLFSTSERMAEETKLYTNKKVKVIPFGVDVSHFAPNKKRDSNKFVIGIIKTLENNYAINDLISAFSLLVQRHQTIDFELHIGGEGGQKEALKQQVVGLGLSHKVKFLGFIPPSQVPHYFNEMDIAVISSLAESFGVSAVEAAACELPVVATRVGGLPEVVIDGKTGLLCEPQNPTDLANKIDTLIADDTLRRAYGRAGRAFVLTKYDWEKNVSKMVEQYSTIAGS
jgi:glycosyltransferase involved in cell wall biosynthesis